MSIRKVQVPCKNRKFPPHLPHMLRLPRVLAVAAITVVVCGPASAGPMRGWMTGERFTCETDCAKFPETCISEHLIRTMADAMEKEGFVAAGYT